MLTYEDILFATTKLLSDNTDVKDVIVDDVEGIFDKECFYVSVVPTTTQASTRITDSKSLMISVKYFGGDKLKCYDFSNKLTDLFTRSIKVNDRILNISNTEPNIFKDEVGSVLDFLIYITYFDYTNKWKIEEEAEQNLDKMQEININKEVIK